jgi:hypothetical protein
MSLSTTVSPRSAALTIAGTVAALVLLAVTPLGDLLLVGGLGAKIVDPLLVVLLGGMAWLDVKGWKAYSPSRRFITVTAWVSLAVVAIAVLA